MSDQVIRSLIAGNFGTSDLYDAARRLKLEIGLQSVIPVARGRKLIASAYTVRFSPIGQATATGLNFYDVISEAPKGSVLVVQVGADRWICGSNITRFAQLSGLAGIVTDGSVRDIGVVAERDYPIYARGISVVSYAAAFVLDAVGESIICGSAAVVSGDIIVGDDDGVVCLPAANLQDILFEAEDIARLDVKLGSDIEARRPLDELHASRTRWSVRRTVPTNR